MGLFGKKSFKVGDEFGKRDSKNQLKRSIAKYGSLLKSSYLPKHDKRTIQEKMQGLKLELQRLNEEEKYYGMQRSIKTKKAKIKQLKGPSTLDKILGPSGSGPQYLTDVPDYVGSMGSGKKSSSMNFKIPKVI